MRTTVRLFFVITVNCLAVGCGPAPQPVWDADSKSFFYTHTNGSVLQYDVDKKATRKILPEGQQRPRQLAISPKAPFMAFTQSAIGAEGRAIQQGFSSLTGDEMVWTPRVVWGDQNAPRDVCPSGCYWCPSGQKVLIWYQVDLNVQDLITSPSPMGYFALYNIQTQTLSELKTATPATILCQAIHVSPICPDGTGYLAMKLREDQPEFLYVGWDGWEYPLSMSDEVAALVKLVADEPDNRQLKDDLWFPLPQGAWVSNNLLIPTRRGAVSFDLKNRLISLLPLSVSQQKEFDRIVTADASDPQWMTIQVAAFKGDQYSLHCRMKKGSSASTARIELVDSQLGRRRNLLEGALPDNFIVHHLFPSPDGQFILACLVEASSHTSQIHVVRADGSILATVNAGQVQAGDKKR